MTERDNASLVRKGELGEESKIEKKKKGHDLYYTYSSIDSRSSWLGPWAHAKLKDRKGVTADRESFDSQAFDLVYLCSYARVIMKATRQSR